MNIEKRANFLGTYFSKETILKLASIAKIFSWIIEVFYILQWVVHLGIMILQIARGLWAGSGPTDIVQNVLVLFEPPLRGLVYFVVLQGVAQVLLMFMDIEDNTRRTARGVKE